MNQQNETKPKRVLTEAQRLAFLKGREKRMANIERKRQEKIEAQDEEHETVELVQNVTTIPMKPKMKEKEKEEETTKEVKMDVDTPAPQEDPMKVEKLADLILDRIKNLKTEASADPIVEPPKLRKKYTKREKRPREAEEEDSVVEPIQKVNFNWM